MTGYREPDLEYGREIFYSSFGYFEREPIEHLHFKTVKPEGSTQKQNYLRLSENGTSREPSREGVREMFTLSLFYPSSTSPPFPFDPHVFSFLLLFSSCPFHSQTLHRPWGNPQTPCLHKNRSHNALQLTVYPAIPHSRLTTSQLFGRETI